MACLGIAAPWAAKMATVEKNGGSDSFAIVDASALNRRDIKTRICLLFQ